MRVSPGMIVLIVLAIPIGIWILIYAAADFAVLMSSYGVW
jgi:hypothetical protein